MGTGKPFDSVLVSCMIARLSKYGPQIVFVKVKCCRVFKEKTARRRYDFQLYLQVSDPPPRTVCSP